jgi:RNA polymerase sigma factor (sigma-70 family)
VLFARQQYTTPSVPVTSESPSASRTASAQLRKVVLGPAISILGLCFAAVLPLVAVTVFALVTSENWQRTLAASVLAGAATITAAWLAIGVFRTLWRVGSESSLVTSLVAVAALGVCVVGGALRDALSPTGKLGALVAREERALILEDGALALADQSPSEQCLANLMGPACDNVWKRAQGFGADAVHSAFIYTCLERQLRGPRLCSSFILKARHLRVDEHRYERRFRDADLDSPACALPSSDEEPLAQAELDVLDNAFARLEERERRILTMAYGEGLYDRLIGTQLGLSETRIRVLRRAAEKKLKANLESCQ